MIVSTLSGSRSSTASWLTVSGKVESESVVDQTQRFKCSFAVMGCPLARAFLCCLIRWRAVVSGAGGEPSGSDSGVGSVSLSSSRSHMAFACAR